MNRTGSDYRAAAREEAPGRKSRRVTSATTVTTGSTRWQIDPLQPDQELDSRRSTGAVYWEGAVTVARDGVPAGRGYLEMTGYVRQMKL